MPDKIPQLLTLLEVAERLRVSTHTVRSWVRKGRLRLVRLCRRLIFDPADIGRLVTENSSAHLTTTLRRSTAEPERIA
jgi:excisionase family DNA binding protein